VSSKLPLPQRLQGPIGRLPFSVRVAAAGTALVVVLAFNAIIALQSSRRVENRELRVRQAMGTEERINEVVLLSRNIDIGARGYLATGDARLIEPYTGAAVAIRQNLAALQDALLPDAQASGLLQTLTQNTNSALDAARRAIDLRKQLGDGLTAVVSSTLVDAQMRAGEKLRLSAEALRIDQSTDLKVLLADSDRARRDAQFLILIPSFISVLLAAFLSFLIVRDLRQRQALEAERQQALLQERSARAEAEASSQAKDEFVSVISHELRTPLQAILGWTELLKRNFGSPQPIQPETLQAPIATIERNAQALAGMIDDLLDVSGAISGRIGLSTEWVDFADIVRRAVELARPAAQSKQVALLLELEAPTLNMEGDAARLRQVVTNLINNALKFTRAGGRVQVSLRDAESGVELRVKDSGIGISPEMLPRIFDRYVQGSVSTNRQYGGLGLGLAIVKHFVELHSGRVEAFSAGLDRGAEFVVRFGAAMVPAMKLSEHCAGPPPRPTNVPQQPPSPGMESSGDSKRLSGLRLLVVDDDEDVRIVLESLLGDEGAEVHTAASAAEGFEKLRKMKMDVILSDISMPDTDGYVLARAVRGFGNAFSATPTTTPMIALTAFSRSEDERRALDSGFNAHLGKPVEVDRLVSVLYSQSRRRPDTTTAGEHSAPVL
jgi:signal transduction histidine kinase/ActR/RegA family two-component response regulator